jgi:CTD small phosphatase-like protein 2
VIKTIKSIYQIKHFISDKEYDKLIEMNRIYLGPRKPELKKTLILDLDETIIHSDLENKFVNHDKILSVKNDNYNLPLPLNIRPGLFTFLKKISEVYEIILFTASKKKYADNILKFLDPERKYFSHVFYRDSCINFYNKVFIKDLKIFKDRNIADIILLDNSMYSFANHLSNGILLTSYYNDKSDTELSNVTNYLMNCINKSKDVRVENEKTFKFEAMFKFYCQSMKK